MRKFNLICENWDGHKCITEDLDFDDGDAAVGAWAGSGGAALAMRFFKLKHAKEMFLQEYPTPEALCEKLEPIMDRNPAARKLYTQIKGMNQTKYIWWIKIKLLKSWSIMRVLGNFLLGPIAMAHQGVEMVRNSYFRGPGDYLNRVINTDGDMDRMYYH